MWEIRRPLEVRELPTANVKAWYYELRVPHESTHTQSLSDRTVWSQYTKTPNLCLQLLSLLCAGILIAFDAVIMCDLCWWSPVADSHGKCMWHKTTAIHTTGDKPFTNEKIHRKAAKKNSINFKWTFAMIKNNLMI